MKTYAVFCFKPDQEIDLIEIDAISLDDVKLGFSKLYPAHTLLSVCDVVNVVDMLTVEA